MVKRGERGTRGTRGGRGRREVVEERLSEKNRDLLPMAVVDLQGFAVRDTQQFSALPKREGTIFPVGHAGFQVWNIGT